MIGKNFKCFLHIRSCLSTHRQSQALLIHNGFSSIHKFWKTTKNLFSTNAFSTGNFLHVLIHFCGTFTQFSVKFIHYPLRCTIWHGLLTRSHTYGCHSANDAQRHLAIIQCLECVVVVDSKFCFRACDYITGRQKTHNLSIALCTSSKIWLVEVILKQILRTCY